MRLCRNEQINQALVPQIEDSQEVGGEGDLAVFTALDIFPVIDLEYEVEECTGMLICCGSLLVDVFVPII